MKLSDIISKAEKEKKISTTWDDCNRIPFTSPGLNYLTYGGIAVGRVVEFCGKEGSGKTTMATDIVKNYLATYKKNVVYIDAENSYDTMYAKTLGVDCTNPKFTIIRPRSQEAEELFSLTNEILQASDVGLVVFDSIGVLLSKQALEKGLDGQTFGGISKALTMFVTLAAPICAQNNVTLLIINQVVSDLANPYERFSTKGGSSLKYAASQRLGFEKGKYINEKGDELPGKTESAFGNTINIRVLKTKVNKPDRINSSVTLYYNRGFWPDMDNIVFGVLLGIINKKGGGNMSYTDDTGVEHKGRGMTNFIESLSRETLDEIGEKVKEASQSKSEEKESIFDVQLED